MVTVANSEAGKFSRRLIAIALTIIFHAIWVTALFDRESGHGRPLDEGPAVTAITLLPMDPADDSVSSDPHPAPPKLYTEPVSEGASPGETDITTSTAQSTSRAVGAPAPAIAVTPQPQESAPAGEVYDPYAGTAPMRRFEVAVSLPSAADATAAQQLPPPSVSSRLFELDAAAFEAVKRKVRQALVASKENMGLRVLVSPGGVVMGATLLSGDVTASDAQKAIGIVVGQQLFIVLDPGATTATIDLPQIPLRRRWRLFD